MRDITVIQLHEMFRGHDPMKVVENCIKSSYGQCQTLATYVHPPNASHISKDKLPADSTQLDKVELLMPRNSI